MASDKLGLDKPGALARYFAERWLNEPSARDEQLIAWLLEAALGRNALYFIEKTKEYVDAWRGSGEIVPENAFDDFVITGDPVEDTIIPHAVLVWTCMNDEPWREEVYHRWLDRLLTGGSAEAAYLAASLWPAHDLMAEVRYRPPRWLVYRGQLDAEAERLVLMEMLRGQYGPRASLYGSFEYDDVSFLVQFPEQYIARHGFTHPICGLVSPRAFAWHSNLEKRIYEALAAPSWSEGVKGAAMLLYLSLKAFNDLIEEKDLDAINSEARLYLNLDTFENLRAYFQELFKTLELNLHKLDSMYINIINFHMDKIEKIDYNLIKDYINYLIILYNQTINQFNLSMKMFSKYISIGLKTKDVIYIGRDFKDVIFNLMLKEKEKVESWLEKQSDDLRIKDILLATYMSKKINYVTIDQNLKIEQVEGKIYDIYGLVSYFDKIRLFIDQARIYFNKERCPHKICSFINDLLKREAKINFNSNFIEDYAKIIHVWHPNREHVYKEDMILNSNHIGLYLYYKILSNWRWIVVDFRGHIKEEKEFNIYSNIEDKIIENLYTKEINNIGVKLKFYLNKLKSNNFPYEEIKHIFIKELINIIKNNYDEILECFKDENKMRMAREVILSNICLIEGNLRDSILFELLGIDNKSKNMIIL